MEEIMGRDKYSQMMRAVLEVCCKVQSGIMDGTPMTS